MSDVVWAFQPAEGQRLACAWVWGADPFPDVVWFDGQRARVELRERNARVEGDGRPDWFVRFWFDEPFMRYQPMRLAA